MTDCQLKLCLRIFFFVSCGAEENGQRLSGDVMQFSKVLSLHLSNLEVMSFSLEESFHCICETQEALRCQAHTHKHAQYTHASNIILSAYIFQGYCYCFYVLIHSFPTYNYQFMPLLRFLPEVFVSIISKQLLFGEWALNKTNNFGWKKSRWKQHLQVNLLFFYIFNISYLISVLLPNSGC